MVQSVTARTTIQGPSSFNKTDMSVDICNPTSLHHCWQMCCAYVSMCVCMSLCMPVWFCMCAWAYICAYLLIILHIFMCLCVSICIYVCDIVCLCVHVYVCACLCIYMYVCGHMSMCVSVCLHMYISLCVCLWRPELDVTQNEPHAPLCPPALILHFCAIILQSISLRFVNVLVLVVDTFLVFFSPSYLIFVLKLFI